MSELRKDLEFTLATPAGSEFVVHAEAVFWYEPADPSVGINEETLTMEECKLVFEPNKKGGMVQTVDMMSVLSKTEVSRIEETVLEDLIWARGEEE